MRRQSRAPLRTALLAIMAIPALHMSSVGAQQSGGYVPPRLGDGTTPDLRGIWQVRDAVDLNVEGQSGGKGVPATRSFVVDPADGKVPYRPDVLARRDANRQQRETADPASKCLQAGVPRATYRPAPLQILQSPGQVAVVYQDNHAYRIFYPSSRPHFTGVDWWMGDSRSYWDGNTLVVDVTTLTDLTWFDSSGNFHSNALHVIERYTPTGRNTLQYEARIEDPNTFTRPWTIRTTLHRNTSRNARLIEDECLEDANGVRRRLLPSDPRNLLINNYRRWKIAAAVRPAVPATPAAAPAAASPPRLAPTLPSTAAAAPDAAAAPKPIPRLPNGKPDFRGTWYKVGGFGLTGTGGGAPGGGGGGGGGFGGGGLGNETGRAAAAASTNEFFKRGVKIPYLPEAVQEKKWRAANQYLDGEPRCHLAGVPRSAEQPPYPHYIIQDENSIAILYEYVHEPRIVPLDGSAHPKNYRAWDGDSRGHWDGDTLVIDVSNFNGRSWLDMAGNFVDENLHVVERYTFKDGDHYIYEATLTDPTVFSEPWKIRFEVRRQAESEQIIEYGCLEGESDLQHYTAETGGLKADVHDATATAAAATLAAEAAAHTVHGCLRGDLNNGSVIYSLETDAPRPVAISANDALADKMIELIDREVRLNGDWQTPGNPARGFTASAARPLAEGCSWNGRSP